MTSSPSEACSLASEDSNSDSKGPVPLKQDGNARSTSTPGRSSPRTGPDSRSTRTSRNSTKRSSPNGSMSCAEDSPASPSAPPGSDEANRTNGSSGPSSSGSFAMFAPDGSLLRMSQGFLQSTLDGSLAEYSGTWPHAGTMRNGILSARPASGRYTPGTEFSSSVVCGTPTGHPDNYRSDESRSGLLTPGEMVMLPTPTAHEGGRNRSVSEGARIRPSLGMMAKKNWWPSPRAKEAGDYQYDHGEHNNLRLTLSGAVKHYPTPNTHHLDVVTIEMSRQSATLRKKKNLKYSDYKNKMFPTPRGGEQGVGMCGGDGSRQMLDRLNSDGELTDSECSVMKSGSGGQLNPTWVEWLMGFPLGWTALEASETRSCLSAQSTSEIASSNGRD